jgi:hypothetical protein
MVDEARAKFHLGNPVAVRYIASRAEGDQLVIDRGRRLAVG